MAHTLAPRDAHYQSDGVILGGTGKTTIFTVPTAGNFQWDLVRLRICLGTGSANTAKISYIKTTGDTEYILNEAGSVAAGIPYEDEGPLHFLAGGVLYVTGQANWHVTYTVSVSSRQPDTDRPRGVGFSSPGLSGKR